MVRKTKALLIIALRSAAQLSFTVLQRSGNMDHREGQIEPTPCHLTMIEDGSGAKPFLGAMSVGYSMEVAGDARFEGGVLLGIMFHRSESNLGRDIVRVVRC